MDDKERMDRSFVQMSPVLWAMPGDEWEGGHVRIEGEHVATLNYQTQAWAPENFYNLDLYLGRSMMQGNRSLGQKVLSS